MYPFTLIVAVGPWDLGPWRQRFVRAAGEYKVRFWPQDGDHPPEGPYVICAWKADPRVFDLFPRPRAVFSLGAGVDHLFALRGRTDLPVFRVVDPDLTGRMVEYVSFAALYLHRQIAGYRRDQSARRWRPRVQKAAAATHIGILGMGVLGSASARVLRALGFQVSGWARSPRTDTAIPIHAGPATLGPFLEDTDILVNLLPRTPATTGLVDRAILKQLGRKRPEKPSFVNAGRGDTVVQDDLIAALRDGDLAGAVLDVFTPEPLPPENPLWTMDNVLVTPHVAADSNPDTIVPQVFADLARLRDGVMPAGRVDLERGY